MKTTLHLDYVVTVEHNEVSKEAQKDLLEAVASNIDAVIYDSIKATMQAKQDLPEAISLQKVMVLSKGTIKR